MAESKAVQMGARADSTACNLAVLLMVDTRAVLKVLSRAANSVELMAVLSAEMRVDRMVAFLDDLLAALKAGPLAADSKACKLVT